MIKKIFYNSSLPRAGSTLIQNILSQNPDIHTTPTSGLYQLYTVARNSFTHSEEFKAQDRNEMENAFRGFLSTAGKGFYTNITNRPYVVDKSRGWISEYNFLNEFDASPKIICMVRDLRGIFTSLEKKYRTNPLFEHNIANFDTLIGTTTYKRMEHWAINVPTGPSLDRLFQVIQDGTHSNILFIRFEDLCENPSVEMEKIYSYFELPLYSHDFDNIVQYTNENDNIYGVFGDHKIKNKLSPLKQDWNETLGEYTCKKITETYAWFYDAFNYKP